MLAAGPMTLSGVPEAATQVNQEVLATFLLERNQRFDLTAAGIVALHDAAVPDAVIDALVAVSYPGRFAVDREEMRPVLPSAAPAPAGQPSHDPYSWGRWAYGSCFSSTSCYGYEAADSRSRTFRYGPSFSSGYLGRPVIVDRTVRRRGSAVSGRGYARGGTGGSGSSARPRIEPPGSAMGSGSYSSSGSQGGTGKASSGGYSRSGGSSSSKSSSAVTGGLTFASLMAGSSHTCGLTPAGAAYCWGDGGDGQLGDGTRTDRLTPTAVTGGLTFASLRAGAMHTCGLTTAGEGYCWGSNYNGQLGDGTRIDTLTPVRVSDP